MAKPTKQEMIDALTAKEISLTGDEKLSDLAALCDENGITFGDSATEVTVRYRDHVGNPTERTFSKEVHGENFAALAEEFKQTNATRIISD